MENKSKESKTSRKRDVKFDGLRVIGLLAIILAHVNPPALLFQMRNFDVPLMVLVSGAVYGLSSGSQKKYFSYIGGRVSRLLYPTWAFLLMFFFIEYLIGSRYSGETIWNSFTLLSGIGYVWIIRVFILVALISPAFITLYHKIQNKSIYLSLLFVFYILYNILNHLYISVPFLHRNGLSDFLFQYIIFYLLSFGFVAGLGLYIQKATKRNILALFVFFTGIFLSLAFAYAQHTHHFMQTQPYKYPPGIYYLTYALAVSLLLYLVSFTSLFQKIFSTKILQFIAFSSLWIYLWQILFLYFWSSYQKYLPLPLQSYIAEYFIIIILSCVMTFLQKKLFTIITDNLHTVWLKSLLTTTFLK